MRYAGIIYNDFAGAPGVQLTFFTQGCEFKCKGCQNPETWDFNGGYEYTDETTESIIKGLTANGIHRTLGIQGGEPLHPQNLPLTKYIVQAVITSFPKTTIYLWTGYDYYEQLRNMKKSNDDLAFILDNITVLIDGLYKEEERDITLPLRGSRNQVVWRFKTTKGE